MVLREGFGVGEEGVKFEVAEFVGEGGKGVGGERGGDEEGGVGWHKGLV